MNSTTNKIIFYVITINDIDYPTITAKQIQDMSPEFIFLSSEPYPFKENHIKEFRRISPNSKIILVDGEYFSWYGSRLIQASEYFIDLMNKMA